MQGCRPAMQTLVSYMTCRTNFVHTATCELEKAQPEAVAELFGDTSLLPGFKAMDDGKIADLWASLLCLIRIHQLRLPALRTTVSWR